MLRLIREAPDEWVTTFHRGWLDAMRGQWPSWYETATEREQVTYEAGRLAVLNVAVAGRVPTWNGDRETLLGPVYRAMRRSALKVGWSLPERERRAS